VTSYKNINVKKITIIALILIGVFFFWWFTIGTERDKAAVVSTSRLDLITVERGNLTESIRATGRLSPVREIQVGSQLSGMIVELFVDFNSEVQAGDLIAKLDTATFEANLALAEAELRNAEAAFELARLREQRIRSLQAKNHLPQSDLDQVVSSLQQALAQVDIRKSHLAKARIELDRCFIVSPTDGIVISRNVDVGQTVAASLSAPVLFQIADDLTKMEIIAHVSEADVGRLALGQRVEFLVDAYRNRRFSGKVTQVRNSPRLVENVVTYDTVIAVDNHELLLKPGMTAEVFIVTKAVENALKIRNSALRARFPDTLRPPIERPDSIDKNARHVFLHTANGEIEVRWILTGITDGVHTEVIQGLDAGASLITGVRLQMENPNDSSRRTIIGGQQATF
jgi:HlyD family secretion protein